MEYSDIYKGLGFCPDIRERVLETYKSRDGLFGSWMWAQKLIMARSLTQVEDEIECEKKYQPYREPLKQLRRLLENELE